MNLNLRQHLENEKKFSRIPLVLLFLGIIFILSYSSFFSSAQLYVGYIRFETDSARARPYVFFHLPEGQSERKYLVLIKDPEFHARIEAMVDKKVQVKARLFKNKPADFDKIEILEIEEAS